MMIVYTVLVFIKGALLYLQDLVILRKMLVDGKISVRMNFGGGLRRQTLAPSRELTIPQEPHGVQSYCYALFYAYTEI